jgi:SHS family lactate transporter-like MFS transporter
VSALADLRAMTGHQWRAFAAAYFAWMLDAFDYFLLVMVERHVAAAFHTAIADVTYALFLTLAFRPVGALLFGQMADHWGRRPALMASVLLYATVELLTAFSPTWAIFLILRAVFGIGMGGVWGVGASLAMESVPVRARGILSGILQQGYPAGYLLAALTYGLVFPHFGWKGLFVVGAAPAVLILFIWVSVRESPSWVDDRERRRKGARTDGIWQTLRGRWPLFLYLIVFMAAFNSFSHGSQDLYPSAFLEKERGFPLQTVSRVAMVYNVGAICGGVLFGALSQRIGRRRAIAAAALLTLPIIPLWIGHGSAAKLAVSAFCMQFAIQGAWGVVPAYLNELSPASVRGTFPGFAYQMGNLAASLISRVQAGFAERPGGSYGSALGWTIAIVAVVLAALALLGPENREARLSPRPS